MALYWNGHWIFAGLQIRSEPVVRMIMNDWTVMFP
jgi:hypothetical protein